MKALDPLEQVVDLEVLVTIGRAAHFGRALAEQRIGFVEQAKDIITKHVNIESWWRRVAERPAWRTTAGR